jgi:hypothetical protein
MTYAQPAAHRVPPAGCFFAVDAANKSLSVSDAIAARYTVAGIVLWRSGAATSAKPDVGIRRPNAAAACTPFGTANIAPEAAA